MSTSTTSRTLSRPNAHVSSKKHPKAASGATCLSRDKNFFKSLKVLATSSAMIQTRARKSL